MYEKNRYRAQVVRWLDGDTVELVVDLGQNVLTKGHYRLARIDAPETIRRRGVSAAEKEAGIALKQRLTAIYPPGTAFDISTAKAGKYGRYIVEIYLDNGDTLSDILLRDGSVKAY